MSEAVTMILAASVREGRLDDARALMEELVESTREEPGTLVYEWFLGADGSSCEIYERYADSDAAVLHTRTFDAAYAARFDDCFELVSFALCGEPSDELRAMIGEDGVIYLGTWGGFCR